MKTLPLKDESHSQPKIVTSLFGRVHSEDIDNIVKTMRECYRRLSPHEVDLVDLYVFERSSSVEAFMADESKRVGVVSSPFDEQFFSMHDAWHGIPRIIICQERMKRLPKLAQKGGIHHEVGHSVLHGSPLYYSFTIPPALLDIARRFKLHKQLVTDMVYLISIAVKDYEVSRLLHKNGYIKDQISFAKHMLAPTESDRTAWEISRAKAPAEALCLISYLKFIGYATPFLTDEDSGKRIKCYIKESLSFLPEKYFTKLLETPKIFQQLGLDTLKNINTFTHLIVERIVEPILKKEAHTPIRDN
jgi:hypothetical protein